MNHNFGDEKTQELARFFQVAAGEFPQETCQEHLNNGGRDFEYINGRTLKVWFSDDLKSIRVDLYNRDQGEGKAEAIIAQLMRYRR